ncbi:MAG: DUF58 domain-containing protein [Rhodanobacteraceae bacterium]
MRTSSLMRRVLGRVVRRAERRLPSLTRLRAPEPLPVRLDRRRIYIVPTAFGFVFASILLVMLLGALNYNNNAALLLTCILAATCITSMLQTFRSLDQLELSSISSGTAIAGDDLGLSLTWRAGGHSHNAIRLRSGTHETSFSIDVDTSIDTQIAVPTSKRGWLHLPRLRVSSRWPFGWFRAWSWIAPDHRVLVYPRPEASGPAPASLAGDANRHRRTHGDEWSGLRAYRSGDPLRRIAWKASARSEDLRVKTFDRPQAAQAWHLDWGHVRLADREARIARLARWVAEAHESGRVWSLNLPENHIVAGQGPAHFHRSMRALAELP